MTRNTKEEKYARILRWHFRHYPRLETRDLVKLAYQDVFGNRHFHSGSEEALLRIENEMKSYSPDAGRCVLVEPVSPEPAVGWVRVNLAAWKQRGGRFSVLADICAASAATSPSDPIGFPERLHWMSAFLSREGIPVPGESLDNWLAIMKSDGYAPVSHSTAYTNLYRPAYRVVRFTLLADLLPLRQQTDPPSMEKTDDRKG